MISFDCWAEVRIIYGSFGMGFVGSHDDLVFLCNSKHSTSLNIKGVG